MLLLQNISYSIKNKTILNNITVSIASGEHVLITGPSGSGKSTLLNLLIRNIKPSEGSIYFNKENICEFNERKLEEFRKDHILLLMQDDLLIDNKTVNSNLLFSGKQNEIDRVLHKVHLFYLKNRLVFTLSGGERQRISIIAAFLENKDIILADETISSLDDETASEMLDFIFKVFSSKTIIFVSHTTHLFKNRVDKIIKIDNGKAHVDLINDVKEKKTVKKEGPILKNTIRFSFIKLLTLILSLAFMLLYFSKNQIFIFLKDKIKDSYFNYNVFKVVNPQDENYIKVLNSEDIKIYINDKELKNIKVEPFFQDINVSYVINKLALDKYKISQIDTINMSYEDLSLTKRDYMIIEEDGIYSMPTLYYNYNLIKDYKGQQSVFVGDISETNSFINNPLFEDCARKEYLESPYYYEYLTMDYLYENINPLINVFFVSVLSYFVILVVLISVVLIKKNVKRIAVSIFKGNSIIKVAFYMTLEYIVLFLVTPCALLYFSKTIFLKALLIEFIMYAITNVALYIYLKSINFYAALKEDYLC